ncbi:MAG: cytochrome c maturation protein CcmE [Coxiella sp. (in: Bacteria)]|nr:MAG: cytochrome c maturation protein CcmE [Coxiella sp. (in: g-proteobacteria)]
MHVVRKRKLIFFIIVICCVSAAVALALYALRKNIDLYFTPSQMARAHFAANQEIRLGGFVVTGSVRHTPNSLDVSFLLTDSKHQIRVAFDGLLPSLFREGQGIIAQGKLNSHHVFIADQVLAKHDSSYHPPGLKQATA